MCLTLTVFLTLWFIHVFFEVLFTFSTFFSVSWVPCLLLIDSQEFCFYSQSTKPLLVMCMTNIFPQFIHGFPFVIFMIFLMNNFKIFFNLLQSDFCPHHCTDTAVLKVRSVVKGRSRFSESQAYGCTLQDKELYVVNTKLDTEEHVRRIRTHMQYNV